MSNKPKQHTPIYIHSSLDDYPLDPYEFRVYARMARRADGNGFCNESVKNVADATSMSPRKVRYALKVLVAAGFISVIDDTLGQTTKYKLMKQTNWVSADKFARTKKETLNPKHPKPGKNKRGAAPDAEGKQPQTPAPHAGGVAHHAEGVAHHAYGGLAPHAAKGTPYQRYSLEGTPEKEKRTTPKNHAPSNSSADTQKTETLLKLKFRELYAVLLEEVPQRERWKTLPLRTVEECVTHASKTPHFRTTLKRLLDEHAEITVVTPESFSAAGSERLNRANQRLAEEARSWFEAAASTGMSA